MKWPNHGGHPEIMKQLFKINNDLETVDFSANLNPLGPPTWVRETLRDSYDTITRYPDPTYSNSCVSLANYVGVEADKLLITNGGAEAIFLVAKYFEKGKALIIHPTFLEYERACNHYYIDVDAVFYEKEQGFQLPMQVIQEKLKQTDVIFLCRPNNPTGTVVKEEDLQLLLDEGKKTGTYIVVDEAFVDFLPSAIPTLVSWLSSYPNLILLRSLTKMYTIPGLRIGYIIANQKIIDVLKNEQIPWSINSLANSLVPKLIEDTEFINNTKAWLKDQSQYVFETLTALDFYISPSVVNFYILQDKKHPNRTDQLFYFLLRHGIVTRHTHNFKSLNGEFIRIAIRSKEENEQLLYFLQKWRNES